MPAFAASYFSLSLTYLAVEDGDDVIGQSVSVGVEEAVSVVHDSAAEVADGKC